MLKLSWGAIGGIYALHYLARAHGPVSVAEIAEHGHLSPTALSKTLQRLRREGLVRGQRGRGYQLARPPGDISILEVVRCLDGPIVPEDLCLMGNRDCVFRATCPMSRLCRELSAGVLTALGGVSLGALPVGKQGLPVCMSRRTPGSP